MGKMKKFGVGQKPRKFHFKNLLVFSDSENQIQHNLKKKPFKVTKYQMPKYKNSKDFRVINNINKGKNFKIEKLS